MAPAPFPSRVPTGPARVVAVTTHWETDPLEAGPVRLVLGSLARSGPVEVWSLFGPGRRRVPDGALVVSDLASLPEDRARWELLLDAVRGASTSQPDPSGGPLPGSSPQPGQPPGPAGWVGEQGGLAEGAVELLARPVLDGWVTAARWLAERPPTLVLLLGDPTGGLGALDPLLVDLVREALPAGVARAALPLLGPGPLPGWYRVLAEELGSLWALSRREAELLGRLVGDRVCEVGSWLGVNPFVLREPSLVAETRSYVVLTNGEPEAGLLFQGAWGLGRSTGTEELGQLGAWLAAGLEDRSGVVVVGPREVVLHRAGQQPRPFPGVRSRADLQRLLAHASCLVIGEPGPVLGQSALEALRLGVPVVAPAGSLEAAHIEDSVGGLVLRCPGEELEACCWMVAEPELAARLGAAGARWAARVCGDPAAFHERVLGAAARALAVAPDAPRSPR